jgi:hypothetical protein
VEQDGDLGGELHPGRASAGYSDREVAGPRLVFPRRPDRREPGVSQGDAQPERVFESPEELEVWCQAVRGMHRGAPRGEHQVLVADPPG